jgi:deoxyribose-phosphate aldolase
MAEIEINRYIDHAVLKPEMTRVEAADAIAMGVRFKVKTVCVRPCDIDLAERLCEGTDTGVCVVLAFPHGDVPSGIKAAEARFYADKGVNEIDMVVNYGYVRSGDWDLVAGDIGAVSAITKSAGIPLKVIFETSVLSADEIAKTTEIAIAAGADYVKTPTGFYGGGATVEAVDIMLKTAAGRIKVKASGGIRDIATAKRFIEMGCQRLGVGYSTTPVLCGEGNADIGDGAY